MRCLARLFLFAGALWVAVGPLAAPAFAYYDDVHYALTYYVARQAGYTPYQAIRIASASSMVDFAAATEPVQAKGQIAQYLVELRGSAQDPRCRFHAFRREGAGSDVVGDGKDAADAEVQVQAQLQRLFEDACERTKNPGVFLHAFQDEKPHHGYGAEWGHNPATPLDFTKCIDAHLPVGSTTDWIAYRKGDVRTLCRSTHSYLTRFMDRVSPHQYARPFYDEEYDRLVDRLAAINPYPAPIRSQVQRQLLLAHLIRTYNGEFEELRKQFADVYSPPDLDRVERELTPGITAVLEQHRKGPDVARAVKTVNEEIVRRGMSGGLPEHHLPYELSADGYLADEGQLDDWVLVGSLELTILANDPVTATLKTTVRDRNGKAKEMDVYGLRPIRMEPGQEYTWTQLPIGELVVEFRRASGATVRKRLLLTARENPFPPIDLREKPENVELAGVWRRSDGHEVRFQAGGAGYTGTVSRLTPNLQQLGFTTGEETFRLSRAGPMTFKGQIKWRITDGHSVQVEWRAVTVTLKDAKTMTDSSTGSWTRIK